LAQRSFFSLEVTVAPAARVHWETEIWHKRGFGVAFHLIGKIADVVESLRGKVGAAVPLKQFIDHFAWVSSSS
jgi:hypothetical protein